MDLLERDAPRAIINDTFKRVSAKEGAIVLVSGEAGIGKTAFVTEFTGSQRPYARVLWGACDPLFTPRPLGPIYDIALRDLPHLLELLNSGANWFAIAAALQKILNESPAPTIVVFEDIHWADEATLDLIKYLGRRVQQAKTLLILTYREDEVGAKHMLHSVLGNLPTQHTIRLRLEPLSKEAVEAIARKMNRSSRGIYEATGGNPFFVTEVLRSEAGIISAAGDIPVTVREYVLTRAAQLDDPARELLELASICPGQAELWLLEAILQPDPSAVDGCVETGFLLPVDQALVFRHELARMAIEESLSLSRSEALHRKALQFLRERSSTEIPLARLVHHATHAVDAQKVLEYGPRAAEQASRHGAHREAGQYYQAAIRYRHLIPREERARLLDSLSFEYYLTGQIDGSIQVRQEAVDLWRKVENAVQVGDDLRWLSRLYWFQGNKALADRFSGEAIAALEALPHGKALAMAYSNQSQLHMLAEENETAIAWGKKALDVAEPLKETEIIIHALTNLGTAEMVDGGEVGRVKLEQALSMALAHEMHDHVARCYACLIGRAVENKDYSVAERYLEEGLAYITDRDMDSYSVYLLGWRARWFFEQGRWAEATVSAEEVLQLHPGSAVIALPGITTLGYVKARQGHPDALHWLDQARELALPTGEFQRIAPVAIARAEAAWWNNQPERVLQETQLANTLSDPTKGGYSLGAIAYWSWKAGGEVRWETKIPTAYRAMIAGDWLTAADEWRRIGCPFERALALADGDADAQRGALAIFDGLGARPAARMLREKMARRGLKGVPRGARSSTKANPEGLTAREMNILALLGQGLSNAEIARRLSISPKTVDHHVSAILAKMQVHSRLEAAVLARQKHIL
jgi:DNA-binding CsgD family transcriptional regulator/tetratricopeptide (TPR) repeat protein